VKPDNVLLPIVIVPLAELNALAASTDRAACCPAG
jgi:hypothetical protein